MFGLVVFCNFVVKKIKGVEVNLYYYFASEMSYFELWAQGMRHREALVT